MGLGVDCTIVRDSVHFLPLITDFGDGVVFLLLELLDDAGHNINEDDLALESAARLANCSAMGLSPHSQRDTAFLRRSLGQCFHHRNELLFFPWWN